MSTYCVWFDVVLQNLCVCVGGLMSRGNVCVPHLTSSLWYTAYT